jgi:hypothetical protein
MFQALEASERTQQQQRELSLPRAAAPTAVGESEPWLNASVALRAKLGTGW